MEHEKCLEIRFHLNAQIEPTLMYMQDFKENSIAMTTYRLSNSLFWSALPSDSASSLLTLNSGMECTIATDAVFWTDGVGLNDS